ncbi:unnamed protein product [Tilletia caries]|nr:unnamed protein product [Tilletia caries]
MVHSSMPSPVAMAAAEGIADRIFLPATHKNQQSKSSKRLTSKQFAEVYIGYTHVTVAQLSRISMRNIYEDTDDHFSYQSLTEPSTTCSCVLTIESEESTSTYAAINAFAPSASSTTTASAPTCPPSELPLRQARDPSRGEGSAMNYIVQTMCNATQSTYSPNTSFSSASCY